MSNTESLNAGLVEGVHAHGMGWAVRSLPAQTRLGFHNPVISGFPLEQRAKELMLQGKIHLDSQKTLALHIICRAERKERERRVKL